MMEIHHEPVLTREVLTYLAPERGGLFVDCTVGLGGHARALLDAGATRLVGLDRDPAALKLAAGALAAWRDRIDLVHSDYRALDAVLDERGIATIDGALADMGLSSFQLEAEGRGFSFRRNEPLVPTLLHLPDAAARADRSLDLVGLPPGEYGERWPAELSGGQR